MYRDEEIFERVVKALDEIGFANLNAFIRGYAKKYVYPSANTVSRRFGGWSRLLCLAMDWRKEQITCGAMVTGTYRDVTKTATITFEPGGSHFLIKVHSDDRWLYFEIPRQRIL